MQPRQRPSQQQPRPPRAPAVGLAEKKTSRSRPFRCSGHDGKAVGFRECLTTAFASHRVFPYIAHGAESELAGEEPSLRLPAVDQPRGRGCESVHCGLVGLIVAAQVCVAADLEHDRADAVVAAVWSQGDVGPPKRLVDAAAGRRASKRSLGRRARWQDECCETAVLNRYRAWSGALIVTVICAALIVLDISGGSVHRYWSRHSFTANVLAGLVVLLLTVLIVDRVIQVRQLKNQSRAVGAPAALIVAQASRTVDAVKRAARSAGDRDEASGELRTYTQMLLTAAPLLIDAPVSRAFLEAAQHVVAELYWVLQAPDEKVESTKTQLDHAVEQLREAAAPLVKALSPEQRAAIKYQA